MIFENKELLEIKYKENLKKILRSHPSPNRSKELFHFPLTLDNQLCVWAVESHSTAHNTQESGIDRLLFDIFDYNRFTENFPLSFERLRRNSNFNSDPTLASSHAHWSIAFICGIFAFAASTCNISIRYTACKNSSMTKMIWQR